MNEIESLRAELKAEKERREQAERQVDRLLKVNTERWQQLLSAQAAIEKIKKLQLNRFDLGAGVVLMDVKEIVESVDLSLLHQHDAEVRKPMVEAAENLLERMATSDSWGKEVDALTAALAQCKGEIMTTDTKTP